VTKASDVSARLTWPQVHAFRLQRHHLAAKAPKKDLARAVGDIGGAQAQIMSAAELQIAVRVDCTVHDVRKALWTDRTLVKTWLMRGTLHLTRAEDLPVYTAAMSRRWIRISNSWLKFWQVTESDIWQLVDTMGEALNGTPMTREELIAIVGKGKSKELNEALRSGWGGMLKPAARNGSLCFGPSRGQSVTFVSPRKWLPEWRNVDPETAMVDAARRYLRAYGPATKEDFGRWWGAWPGVGKAAWSGLAPELVDVSLEGSKLQALESDVGAIQKARIEQPVQLLPLFDPYLMGYANRDHLFEKVHAPKVSRTAGWISAVVLVNGRVEGTWTHAMSKGTLRIDVVPFKRLSASVTAEVRKRAVDVAKALGAARAEVKFA
jgi:winged helix DNA-binding protein